MTRSILLWVWLLSTSAISQETKPMKHIFYLHGMIIEVQGINAESEEFGPYKYEDILDSLEATGARVHSEVRTTNTDFNTFSEKISAQINALIQDGIQPHDISVIGASKGAMMAMAISSLNKQPVNYILLGGNSEQTEQSFDWKLHGSILGIYEKSDLIAGKDYSYWIARSPEARVFQQLQLNTGLGHGFLYRPIEEWLGPALEWIMLKH